MDMHFPFGVGGALPLKDEEGRIHCGSLVGPTLEVGSQEGLRMLMAISAWATGDGWGAASRDNVSVPVSYQYPPSTT